LRIERGERDATHLPPDVDVLALDEALSRLEALEPRWSRLVELRFFAGLTVGETASVLGVSPATVKRDWSFARAWLYRELHRRRTDDNA
jgi:RNA polymerase sigma factor (sigma-70 family)